MFHNENETSIINMRNRTVRLDREGDFWTQDERDQLIRLFNNGAGITAMAMELQRTEPAIMQQIEKLNLYNRKTRRSPEKPRGGLQNASDLDGTPCPFCGRPLTAKEEP